MKTYRVLYAEDVPHYGIIEIEAEDDLHAIRKAQSRWHDRTEDRPTSEPDWSNTFCHRIVNILDDQGKDVANDIPLDGCFLRYGGEPDRLRCEAAEDLLNALKYAHAQVLILAKERDPDQLGLWDAIFTPAKQAIARAEGGQL